jgi:hypothetical protein
MKRKFITCGKVSKHYKVYNRWQGEQTLMFSHLATVYTLNKLLAHLATGYKLNKLLAHLATGYKLNNVCSPCHRL